MQRTPDRRLVWIALVVSALVASVVVGVGATQTSASASTDGCESDDCEPIAIERSIAMMLERFGWESSQTTETVMMADETVMSSETEDGEIRVAGEVAPGETVTITLTDGLADADVTVNGEPVAPSDADGEIEVVVPEDGEVTIVVEVEQTKHEISLAGDETGTEVSSSTSSSGSSTSVSSTTSTTSVSTSLDST